MACSRCRSRFCGSPVTNDMLADMDEATFKMRAAGAGSGPPIDGTATQAKEALDIQIADVEGLSASFGGAYKAGWYTGPRCINAAMTIANPLGELDVAAFSIPQACSVDRISCAVTTVGAGSVFRMGIYRADPVSGLPGALVLDAGTINSAVGTGVKELVINQALTPGVYFIGGVAQGGVAPTMRAFATGLIIHADAAAAITSPTTFGGFRLDGVAGALPNPFGPPTYHGSQPRVVLRYV